MVFTNRLVLYGALLLLISLVGNIKLFSWYVERGVEITSLTEKNKELAKKYDDKIKEYELVRKQEQAINNKLRNVYTEVDNVSKKHSMLNRVIEPDVINILLKSTDSKK